MFLLFCRFKLRVMLFKTVMKSLIPAYRWLTRPMKGNPRQSWILDSTLWIPDSEYWIPDSKKGWIPNFLAILKDVV